MIPAALDAPERAIVSVVNAERAREGLRTLRPTGPLSRAANSQTATIVRTGAFTHGSPLGVRLSAFGNWPRTGEALAFSGRKRPTARTFLRLWLNSPGHRALLLDGAFSQIGIARSRGKVAGRRGVVVTLEVATTR